MDEEAVLEGAAEAVDVAEVVDRGPARVDPFEQRRDDGVAQAPVLLECQPPGGPQRVDAGTEEGLVGVDVADARDAALVEQEGLDRGASPAGEVAQVRGREALVERLDPEARREEALELLVPQHQLAGPEAPRIDDHEPLAPRRGRAIDVLRRRRRGCTCGRRSGHACRVGVGLSGGGGARGGGRARPELDPYAHVRRLGPGLAEHRARHAQVLDEVDLVVEHPDQVLAAALEPQHASPAQRIGQFVRLQRTRPAGVEDLDLAHAPALDERRELASDGLDLGKLGHGRPSLCARRMAPGSATARGDGRSAGSAGLAGPQRDARGCALK